MYRILKHILIFCVLMLINSSINAQFYFLEDAYDQLELEFMNKKVEVSARESFFNLVKIKNPSNSILEFQTNFSYPAQWSFMGVQTQRVRLEPHDSIYLPFRAAPSHNVKGGIGYSIVASISDFKGVPIKNEYSFVNVPKIQSMMFRPVNRVVYIDPARKTAELGLSIVNNGNTDEIVYVDLNFDSTVETYGTQDNLYKIELTVKPLTDTIISVPVYLISKANYYDKKFHRVNVKTYTKDTSFNSTIWLKELDSYYINEIPDNYKMLTVEVAAQNLFSSFEPSYSLYVDGNILFKDDSDINYNIRGYGSSFWKDPWQYGRYVVNYSRKGLRVSLGDISKSFGQSMYGRGGLIDYTRQKTNIEVIATHSLFYKALNIGGAVTQVLPSATVGGGLSYVNNETRKVDSKVAFVDLGKSFKKAGSFKLKFNLGLADWYYNEHKSQVGYNTNFGYNNKFGKTKLSLTLRYGTPEYFGGGGGTLLGTGNIYVPISKGKSLYMSHYNMQYSPVTYVGDSLVNDDYNNYNETRVTYNQTLSRIVSFSAGGIIEGRSTNKIYTSTSGDNFSTLSPLLYGYLKVRSLSSMSTFTANFKGGISKVTDFPVLYNSRSVIRDWVNFQTTLSYRDKLWGLSAMYLHGPYTVNQQFAYFSGGYFAKTLRLMPYLDLPIYRGYLRFISRLNFDRNITSEITRINLANELVGYPGKSWRVSLSNTVNYQANFDKVTNEKYKYTSTYFELRVRKEFLINQPRYKYHNLSITFYKDLNGNKIRDPEEPGIKNVLMSIKKDEDMENDDYNTVGYFMPVDLLSDFSGNVSYDNVPEGFYLIEYFPVSKIEGAFSSDETMQLVRIDEDKKLDIPFTESNKIFGNIILNRSKLTNLGSIDLGNLKVTAEDSYGKKYSALTNSKGEFRIYVPNVDKYTVSVNNIFYENFSLEQNNYKVQLNGYRQFEVNFIFNEKRRKVNFSTSYDSGMEDQGIEIIRRTNLSGIVKDATTLKPIVADVRVVDKSGRTIASGKTGAKTGVFTLSFIAGDDYVVEVVGDEYWYYAEDLNNQQLVTFKNVKKEILLKGITVGQLIPMKTLNFESGSSEIPSTSFPELDRLLKALLQNPSVKIAVHGHADDLEVLEVGSDVALDRAKIVARYLIANGYNRVKYLGYKNTRPIDDNDTESGRMKNRRVEIVVEGK